MPGAQGPKTVKGAQSDQNYVSRLLLVCVPVFHQNFTYFNVPDRSLFIIPVANVCRGGPKIIVTPLADWFGLTLAPPPLRLPRPLPPAAEVRIVSHTDQRRVRIVHVPCYWPSATRGSHTYRESVCVVSNSRICVFAPFALYGLSARNRISRTLTRDIIGWPLKRARLLIEGSTDACPVYWH